MAGGGSLRDVPGPERYRLAGHGDRGTSLRRRRGSEGIGARRGGFWRLFHRRDGFGIPPADVETGPMSPPRRRPAVLWPAMDIVIGWERLYRLRRPARKISIFPPTPSTSPPRDPAPPPCCRSAARGGYPPAACSRT